MVNGGVGVFCFGRFDREIYLERIKCSHTHTHRERERELFAATYLCLLAGVLNR